MRALSGVNVDALIIGGGAAGTYCAIHAAARGLRVAILEKNLDIGAKIRVSGGGRCNMTNRDIAPPISLIIPIFAAPPWRGTANGIFSLGAKRRD